ncbi:hypothetical protein GCM10009847_19940 [Leucobacter tardus]|uniref:DNA polymerase III subunit gamma/tau n=1 Tax=Leucobacter tardus TaxID=501483 RepID=A0A939TKP5_9MICO|nr:hypothetical protein [Leucobacter tardus]MBO2990491.1 hypothetical protein [Leucobacter tardus]
MRNKSPREPREPRDSALASGWTVEGAPEPATTPAEPVPAATELATRVPGGPGTDAGADPADPSPDSRQQLSNGALVLLGVIGGLYLIYTYVWMTWAQYYSGVNTAVAANSGVIGGALQQIVFWAAPAAPALWFLSAVLLNRGRSTGRLAVALIVGAILLVPVPMLVSSGGAL